MAEVVDRIEPTAFQQAVLTVPEHIDLFLGGGRGGGKTHGVLFIVTRHVETYGSHARVLVVRKNFPDLRDFEAEARYLFTAAYGKQVTYNGQDHMFRFANGATVQLEQYEGMADFSKFQGKSYSLICIEEAGQYPDPAPLDMLRSSLRSKAGIPCRMVLSANPGGSGHGWLNKRHVAGVSPWKPYQEQKSGRQFVTAPSTLTDNPHLGGDYAQQIEAATSTDPALQKAWLYGDWRIARGAFFGAVFDSQRNVVDPWPNLPVDEWEYFIAGDHGSAAPCVFYVVARSFGAKAHGKYYPAGSLVLVDEIAFREKDTLNKGLGLTVPSMAQEVVAQCKYRGIQPKGCLDDACFANHGSDRGTLAAEYRAHGINCKPVMKGDRLTGWERMRRLLADAGKPDLPGLYISEACGYWLETVPYLDRSKNRPEDVDTTGPDHAADACRYACIFEKPVMPKVSIGWPT